MRALGLILLAERHAANEGISFADSLAEWTADLDASHSETVYLAGLRAMRAINPAFAIETVTIPGCADDLKEDSPLLGPWSEAG